MQQAVADFKRWDYFRNDDFHVYLEYFSDQLFVHVGIFNFDKSVLAQIKEVWANVALDAYFDGYEDLFAYTKDNRIIKLIGGAVKVGQHENYEVWKWELQK